MVSQSRAYDGLAGQSIAMAASARVIRGRRADTVSVLVRVMEMRTSGPSISMARWSWRLGTVGVRHALQSMPANRPSADTLSACSPAAEVINGAFFETVE